MRPRRVPTRRVENDLDRVCSRGDRAQTHSDLACLESRIAVQSKDSGHAVERAGSDDVECTTRHDFLGGLEDQPNPDGKFGQRGQSQSGAEQDGGVGVVPACMRHTGDRGRVRRPGRLLHRQSVHVGAKCDSRPLRSDVAREPGATGKDLRRQPSGGEAGRDEFGGRVFAASQLRVGMDVSTPRDEVVGVRVNPRVDCRVHRRSTPSNRRVRCSGSDATRTAVRANAIAPSTTARSAEVVIHAAANSG